MEAKEFVDLMRPEHDRTSCSDTDRNNSFFSRGDGWKGCCTRCMWLDLADGIEPPMDFNPEQAFG